MDFSITAQVPEMDFSDYRTKNHVEMDFSKVQDKATRGDGLLHDHAGTSRTGVGYGRSTHGRTDDDVTDGHYPLPDTDKLSKSPCIYRCEITSF
jgi:hypothetical protein